MNSGSITVTLDAFSSELVRWYADLCGEAIEDVIHGALSGTLLHVREELEQGAVLLGDGSAIYPAPDDSPTQLQDAINRAIARREGE